MSYADNVLRYHVTGAIERGEAVPIVEVPITKRPMPAPSQGGTRPDPRSIMNLILVVTEGHDAGCQCPWDRAFDALSDAL